MYYVKSNDNILKSLYNDMKEIRMEVVFPFLLKVHDDYYKSIITINELYEIIRLCISYVFRRFICNIPTASLNKTFATMKNFIDDKDYLTSIKSFFIQLDSYKEFPDDKKFTDTFIIKDLYNTTRCRYILDRLENWDNKSVVSLENLTIEHIIPQTPQLSLEWITTLGSDWKNIQKKYLHTIGNLTLTAYNSEMSNYSFYKKLNMNGGFKESALRLNKYVILQNTWGEKQVEERALLLSDIAKKVWSYPYI